MNDNTAIVTISAVMCGRVYTITAGGLDDSNNLVGPQFRQETITTGPCPVPPTTSSVPNGM